MEVICIDGARTVPLQQLQQRFPAVPWDAFQHSISIKVSVDDLDLLLQYSPDGIDDEYVETHHNPYRLMDAILALGANQYESLFNTVMHYCDFATSDIVQYRELCTYSVITGTAINYVFIQEDEEWYQDFDFSDAKPSEVRALSVIHANQHGDSTDMLSHVRTQYGTYII